MSLCVIFKVPTFYVHHHSFSEKKKKKTSTYIYKDKDILVKLFQCRISYLSLLFYDQFLTVVYILNN